MRILTGDVKRKSSAHRWSLWSKWFTRMTVVILVITLTSFVPPQNLVTEEYQVKAAFLYNFAQFVEWPSSNFTEADSAIVIGILGKDPFGSFLQETVKGESVNGHPIVIKHYDDVKEINQCHILFINLPPARLDNTVSALKGKDILTVSDGSNFTKVGGMIRFKKESNKIKLQINLGAVKSSDIVVSSKLLRLSEIVE